MGLLPNLARLSLTAANAPKRDRESSEDDDDENEVFEYDDASDRYDDALDDSEEPPRSRPKTTYMSGPEFKPPPTAPRQPAAVPTHAGPAIESGTPFQDVDWRRIMDTVKDGKGKTSFSFTVHVQELPDVTPPGRVWEIKMRLERQEYDLRRRLRTVLVIEPPGAPAPNRRRCVEIVLEDKQSTAFVINSLFYDLGAGEETALCGKEMLASKDWSDPNARPGQGAIVLQIVDALAPLLGTHRLELVDGSRFAPDSSRGNPNGMAIDMFMTTALALLRGYGYYEARGYFSNFLVQDPFIAENGHVNPQRMSDHAHADLLWTEVVMNTRVDKLHEAILGFPNTLAERWSYWSSSSFEEGLSPAFKTHLYGIEACKRHAARAEEYICEMLHWCSSDVTDSEAHSAPVERNEYWGKWMDHFDELSIRDIRRQTMAKVVEMENSALNESDRFDDVPMEHHRVIELIDTFIENVWYRYIDTGNSPESPDFSPEEKYPSATLEKVIFTQGGNPPYRSLKIEPGARNEPPRVVLVDNRDDFTCESATGIAAVPFQPRRIVADEDME